MSKRAARVHETPGYVLHATAWKETSLIVQAFSRDHGWVSMVAKGAKRPHSVLRPALSLFQPLLLSWTGASEIKTLTRAECAGVHVAACVIVARDSHKPILLGVGGSHMKRIASEARQDIAKLLDKPIHLEVYIKVKKGWAEKEGSLRDLGYE